MSRTERLFQLLQFLRRHRYAVSAEKISNEMNISLRTVYRDIATLKSQGADIQGEAGVGYILNPGFILPPLMFTQEELEALILGTRWVAKRADNSLSFAAKNAQAKIAAVLTTDLKNSFENSGLLIGPSRNNYGDDDLLKTLRLAIQTELKIKINYKDITDKKSKRILWPIALGYFDNALLLVAWCEMREAFRYFRTDRIEKLHCLAEKYPQRRNRLIKEWRKLENIPSQ